MKAIFNQTTCLDHCSCCSMMFCTNYCEFGHWWGQVVAQHGDIRLYVGSLLGFLVKALSKWLWATTRGSCFLFQEERFVYHPLVHIASWSNGSCLRQIFSQHVMKPDRNSAPTSSKQTVLHSGKSYS